MPSAGNEVLPGWEELGRSFQKLAARTIGLRASWSAYAGREHKGVWWIEPRDEGNALVRAEFSLLCAKAATKLGLEPEPIPTPDEHSPCWSDEARAYALEEVEEGAVRICVPYGLGAEDLDAVDPLTRAWLENLRKSEIGFRVSSMGENIVAGRRYATTGGNIKDVLGSSATFCLRAARSEVGSRPVTQDGSVGTPTQGKSRVASNAVYTAIDKALREISESSPSDHQEVFRLLDSRGITRPQLDWLQESWAAGFLKYPTRARSWLSKRWARNVLPSFSQGLKGAK